ncbi:MAG: hypothetical protein BA864_14180 [Desulfuromonadales bacterium C00003093]|nr:MAG: hypothetical protein BA864_14180 [Desulfuromonadales bacterium C00003093]
MPQIDIVAVECTTVTGYAGLSFSLPGWAPDIAAIGTTAQEPYNMRASTSDEPSMSSQVKAKFSRAGPRSFLMEGNRNVKGEIQTVRLHYMGINELVRT